MDRIREKRTSISSDFKNFYHETHPTKLATSLLRALAG